MVGRARLVCLTVFLSQCRDWKKEILPKDNFRLMKETPTKCGFNKVIFVLCLILRLPHKAKFAIVN